MLSSLSLPPVTALARRSAPRAFRRLGRWGAMGWGPTLLVAALVAGVLMLVVELVVAPAFGVAFTVRAATLVIGGAVGAAVVTSRLVGGLVLSAHLEAEAARRRLERWAERLERDARRAERGLGLEALSRLLAHELRAPLHTLSLDASVLERIAPDCDPVAQQQIRTLAVAMRGETEQLARLVDEYLNYAQTEGSPLAGGPLDLPRIIDETVLAHAARLSRSGVDVDVAVEPDLPPVTGDRPRLLLALHHLIANASDAAGSGGRITLAVRACPDRHGVDIVVGDDGPGFADPSAAFRPFYSTKGEGAGLGLAIVREVARAHAGSAEACNRAAGGAEVRLHLPGETGP